MLVSILSLLSNSHVPKTVGKGTSIAVGICAFEEFPITSSDTVDVVNATVPSPPSNSGLASNPIDTLTAHMTHLSPPQLQQATQLLTEFKEIFSLSNATIGHANVSQFDFSLEHSNPISTPLRRVPLHQQELMNELLQHYKKHGLIEHIESPYRAATLLVSKKNVSACFHVTDRYRLVVDYRFLNNAIKDSGWPTPSLEQGLDAASGSNFVSSIDFNSGYHQIPCAEDCKPILAFSPGYGFGMWTWKFVPQGIKPASSHFQRIMEEKFSDLTDCFLSPFYDDIVIKGSTFNDHLSNVRKVLTRIRDTGLTLNALKCRFFQTQLPYLGHIIDKGQIRLDPARVKSILDLPVPSSPKALKEFLGMAQICDRFIPNYSIIAAPLHEQTRSRTSFNWTAECQQSFQTIKTC